MVRLGRNGLEARRLRGAREIIAQVADHLRADLSVELWNGERLPLGPGAREDIRIAIRSPAAARRLIVNPSFMSVVELYAEGELDLVGATPLEASRRWDHDRSLELLRKVDRWAAFKSAMPFLVGRARSRSVADYDRTVDRRLPNPGVKATDWTVRPAPREKESVCIASRSRRSGHVGRDDPRGWKARARNRSACRDHRQRAHWGENQSRRQECRSEALRAGAEDCVDQLDLYLIKPTRYDDDGYPVQWWRSAYPVQSLACVAGLVNEALGRGVLAGRTAVKLHVIDETNTKVEAASIVRASRRDAR